MSLNSHGWLRKFYPPGSDEAHFDLTAAAEKALAWLESLAKREFIGTESRLLTVFELLRQIASGSQTDPQLRIDDLEQRRQEIDAEIKRIQNGEAPLLNETAMKDRFQQLATTARELLSDFREVEENFRLLDRTTRERIALWEGAKGDLLESVFSERDTIADSDQGKSFRAFWDFLMDPRRQEELSALLDYVFALPSIRILKPDARLKRVHYEWLDAGEHAQRTVALLSQQLRRFLDDQVWLENRRIMQILHEIEAHALAIRQAPPPGPFMELDDTGPDIGAAGPLLRDSRPGALHSRRFRQFRDQDRRPEKTTANHAGSGSTRVAFPVAFHFHCSGLIKKYDPRLGNSTFTFSMPSHDTS